MKILLVEDNLLNQRVVIFNLRKINCTITAVTNGLDAIKNFTSEDFDLILMDLMLPGMNGIEITKEIRKIESKDCEIKQIPIVALTANTLDNEKKKCFDAGMNGFLSKPFSSDELINTIKSFFPEK